MMDYIAGYLVAVNILTFLLYGADKRRARKSQRRISERTLLSLAAIGGSIGALRACDICSTNIRNIYWSMLDIPYLCALMIHILESEN